MTRNARYAASESQGGIKCIPMLLERHEASESESALVPPPQGRLYQLEGAAVVQEAVGPTSA